MRVPAFDQNDVAGAQGIRVAVDHRLASAAFHVQPLVRAVVEIVRAALFTAGLENHRGDLRPLVSNENPG